MKPRAWLSGLIIFAAGCFVAAGGAAELRIRNVECRMAGAEGSPPAPQPPSASPNPQSEIFTSRTGGKNPQSDQSAIARGDSGTPSERNPQSAMVPPVPAREFRGVWVATVANIDWPSKPGLPAAEQQQELLAILDCAARGGLNAVVFQVRPACDALYESPIEPWSEYLTGKMGRGPDAAYDPLRFAVEEAHRRGLELHAWFNPYRARHPTGKSEISANHVSKTRPGLVRTYGKHLWLDPGMKEVQDYTTSVIRDVVRRYDVDGVHLDDYFYPYKERDAAGKLLPFPDEPSWKAYGASGGKLNRDDWRRENVNTLVRRLYREIKQEKPHVRFGISPFGIWRPGYPAQIQGFDAYQELYADARRWLVNGWVDYFTPQLYWKIDQKAQSYPVLLKWWTEQNPGGRHLWPGNFTSRVADGSATAWSAEEVVNQVRATRAQPGAGGNVHFSMKPLMQNRDGIVDRLTASVYGEPALVPATPWLDDTPPGRPGVEIRTEVETGRRRLHWEPTGEEKPWLWVVQLRTGGGWTTEILPADRLSRSLTGSDADYAAVSAVDRCGNQCEPVVAPLK
jgi:uncharacterized lipoprotein YddW (UPF0748 family)